MVRQAITWSAIEQAIGRVRGVNRTATDPVEVYLIIHDVVVPGIEVDEVVEFGNLEPDAIDQMLARGWEPQMPADAAKLHPDLFPSREAAKKAYQRDRLRTGKGARGPRLGTSSGISLYTRGSPHPPCVALLFQPSGRGQLPLQPSGRGQLPRYCIVDPVKVPDPRAVLEAAWQRPLVRFEVVKEETEMPAAE
jgi:hypothetical protein